MSVFTHDELLCIFLRTLKLRTQFQRGLSNSGKIVLRVKNTISEVSSVLKKKTSRFSDEYLVNFNFMGSVLANFEG